MDMITLALANPKHINLDDYGITPVLLNLFANDGGTATVEDVGNFWNEVNTNRPMTVSFAFPPNDRVNVFVVTTVQSGVLNGNVGQLCFEGIVETNAMVFRVAAMITRDLEGGAIVTVRTSVIE